MIRGGKWEEEACLEITGIITTEIQLEKRENMFCSLIYTFIMR